LSPGETTVFSEFINGNRRVT